MHITPQRLSLFLSALVLSVLCFSATAHTAFAQSIDLINDSFINESAATQGTKLGSSSPVNIASAIISAFLGILGILAVVYLIYGGFLWMTGGGNDTKLKKARDILRAAFIGLILIIASYSIATFIFSALEQSTGFGGSTSTTTTETTTQ